MSTAIFSHFPALPWRGSRTVLPATSRTRTLSTWRTSLMGGSCQGGAGEGGTGRPGARTSTRSTTSCGDSSSPVSTVLAPRILTNWRPTSGERWMPWTRQWSLGHWWTSGSGPTSASPTMAGTWRGKSPAQKPIHRRVDNGAYQISKDPFVETFMKIRFVLV